MKVKLSFGQKAVISSLSKLSIELKKFFYKSCLVLYTIWECVIKIARRTTGAKKCKSDKAIMRSKKFDRSLKWDKIKLLKCQNQVTLI